MDHVTRRTRVVKQLYTFAAILAHDVTGEFQMQLDSRAYRTFAKRGGRDTEQLFPTQTTVDICRLRGPAVGSKGLC